MKTVAPSEAALVLRKRLKRMALALCPDAPDRADIVQDMTLAILAEKKPRSLNHFILRASEALSRRQTTDRAVPLTGSEAAESTPDWTAAEIEAVRARVEQMRAEGATESECRATVREIAARRFE